MNNNSVVMRGRLGEIEYSHSLREIKFYKSILGVMRTSGIFDFIPIVFHEQIKNSIGNSEFVEVAGEFRSRNFLGDDGKTHLQLYVYVKSAEKTELGFDDSINELTIAGYLCNKGQLRETPKGRVICDFFLAAPRSNGITDYIPCIAWESNAGFIDCGLAVGALLTCKARIQSREYDKFYPDGTKETKVAYEASVSEIEVIEDGAEVEQ
jgi:hypothetical protein